MRRIGIGSTIAQDLEGFTFDDVEPVRAVDCALYFNGTRVFFVVVK